MASLLLPFGNAEVLAPPAEEFKHIQGFRHISFGSAILTNLVDEVPNFIDTENTGVGEADLKEMLKQLQNGYKQNGMLLVLAGIGKELAVIHKEDPENKFGAYSGESFINRAESRYVSTVELVMQLYSNLQRKKGDVSWIDLVFEEMRYPKTYREAYVQLRQSLEDKIPKNLAPAAFDQAMLELNTKTLAYVRNQVETVGLFEKFYEASAKEQPITFAMRKLFGPKRVYALGLSINGRAFLPIGSIVDKVLFKKMMPDFLKNSLNNSPIGLAGGSLIFAKGKPDSKDIRDTYLASTSFSQIMGGVGTPSLTKADNHSNQQISLMVRLAFIYSDSELQDFDIMDLNGKVCGQVEITQNLQRTVTSGWWQKLADQLTKEFDVSGSFAIFKDNISWALGRVIIDEDLHGKVPTRVLSFGIGGLQKELRSGGGFKGYATAAGEWAPFRVDPPKTK